MADYTSDAGREPIDPRKLPFIRLIRRTYVKKRTDVGIDLTAVYPPGYLADSPFAGPEQASSDDLRAKAIAKLMDPEFIGEQVASLRRR